MIMESNEAETLLRTPIIIKIPGINSANAIGICISAGSPNGPVRNPTKPSPNLLTPWAMKIAPMADLKPIIAMSFNFPSENFASGNIFERNLIQ